MSDQHTCCTCGDGFATKEEMQQHALDLHSRYLHNVMAKNRPKNRGPYPCSHCDRSFASPAGVEQHTFAKHGR